MHKHLHLVPSLVVVFFELDWNDSSFKEKQTELRDKIDVIRYEMTPGSSFLISIGGSSFRTSLEGHAAAISVVLLQNKNSFPTGKC